MICDEYESTMLLGIVDMETEKYSISSFGFPAHSKKDMYIQHTDLNLP